MTISTINILVVGPAWIGDMVMAQSLFKKLKETRPDCRISVMAPNWTLPLLERMPEVAESIPTSFVHKQLQLAARFRLGKDLRGHRFDQAIVLPGSVKSALVPFIARIPHRTGYLKEPRYGLLNDVRRLKKAQQPLQVQRFVQLALPTDHPLVDDFPKPRLTTCPQNIPGLLTKLEIPQSDTPALALCPGAEYGPAKRWPPRHFAELASTKLADGWQVWLLGAAQDAGIARDINDSLDGRCHDLTGHTNLGEVVDLLHTATQVVSNDSGLMHVAAAVGTPLVVVYGASTPDFTPPLSDTARSVSLEPACLCFRRVCPLGHTRCLEDLTPGHVSKALAALGCAST